VIYSLEDHNPNSSDVMTNLVQVSSDVRVSCCLHHQC